MDYRFCIVDSLAYKLADHSITFLEESCGHYGALLNSSLNTFFGLDWLDDWRLSSFAAAAPKIQ